MGAGDAGGPGSVFMQDMIVRDREWHSRLYVDGNGVDPPKPLIIDAKNPVYEQYNIEVDNKADVHFDELMLNNKVWFDLLNEFAFCCLINMI